jgi:HD superfamily phosphodiesterase
MDKINKIKQLIKKECDEFMGANSWFYENHLLAAEKAAKFLLGKLPKANKEVVLLGVWLHDLQRVRNIDGDHQKIGAREAEKVLKDFGYDAKTISEVKEVILSHSCEHILPKTLEGKILASADAMSHYGNDFYLRIATMGERFLEEYKEWALEKLNRDYNKKIFFPFAKKKIKSRHQALIKILTMK